MNVEIDESSATTKDPADFLDAVRTLCRVYGLQEPEISVTHGKTKYVASMKFPNGLQFHASDVAVSRACEKAAEFAVDYFSSRGE